MSCKCHTTCFKKKGPGFCNICLHIDKKFTSRTRIACLPNPHFHDQRVAVRVHERSYIHGYSFVKSMARRSLLSLNHPPKIPTYDASTYQKGSFLIDARLFCPHLFLQSFTVHALLLSENKEKNVFHGFENSTGHFLLLWVLASFCHSKRMHLHNYCPDTTKL